MDRGQRDKSNDTTFKVIRVKVKVTQGSKLHSSLECSQPYPIECTYGRLSERTVSSVHLSSLECTYHHLSAPIVT